MIKSASKVTPPTLTAYERRLLVPIFKLEHHSAPPSNVFQLLQTTSTLLALAFSIDNT